MQRLISQLLPCVELLKWLQGWLTSIMRWLISQHLPCVELEERLLCVSSHSVHIDRRHLAMTWELNQGCIGDRLSAPAIDKGLRSILTYSINEWVFFHTFLFDSLVWTRQRRDFLHFTVYTTHTHWFCVPLIGVKRRGIKEDSKFIDCRHIAKCWFFDMSTYRKTNYNPPSPKKVSKHVIA